MSSRKQPRKLRNICLWYKCNRLISPNALHCSEHRVMVKTLPEDKPVKGVSPNVN